MKPSRNHEAWLDAAVFEDADDGEVLRAFLADRGFEVRTNDDKLLRGFLFLRPPRATCRVQVRKSHFEGTEELVRSKCAAVLDKAIHCPACGSLAISYPQMTRKFLLPTVLLHLGIIFRVVEHQCYCEDCHLMWNLPAPGAKPLARETKPFPL